MGKRPTVYDVAERAGVSIATVSFAFRRPDQVREETRLAVLEAAKDIGYIPSASARGLARGRTGALGLHSFDFLLEHAQRPAGPPRPETEESALDIAQQAIPWEDTNEDSLSDARAFPLYVDEVQRGFELECKLQGRPLLLSSGTGSAASLAETAGWVDGLAIFPTVAAPKIPESISLGLPVVLFSSAGEGDRYHRVIADNVAGMRDLVTHLVEEHRPTGFGFVGGLTVSDFKERFDSFRQTLHSLEQPVPDDVLDDSTSVDGSPFSGLIQAIEGGRLPGALVCASDQIALMVLDLLARHDISVPGDVLVTGFDGIIAGQLSTPTLTTVRQPMESMGRVAARLLIAETSTPHGSPLTIRLGTRLMRRHSCGC
jgi:LacI family transcriptional regulator